MHRRLLVTGGAGYIGSHTLVELIAAGYEPVVLDNLSNSQIEAVRRVEEITGKSVSFFEGDIRDEVLLNEIFVAARNAGDPFKAVVHFAALKSVGESVSQPLRYYENNIYGTLVLLKAMERAGVHSIVFSSSATVYSPDQPPPYTETARLGPSNPYGQTKSMVEQILADICAKNPDFSALSLRYFNPIGAHLSGIIGEDPRGVPNNLFPYITQVAIGKHPRLKVYGTDYPTIDGTGVRDYVHVSDLAEGHVCGVRYVIESKGYRAVNLGTGNGTSVLQMIEAFQGASGRQIPWEASPRRPGDLAECWADPKLARELLGWTASRNLVEMCVDGWRWQSTNPNGYHSGS